MTTERLFALAQSVPGMCVGTVACEVDGGGGRSKMRGMHHGWVRAGA
jgi:hypothetical protein